MGNSRVYFPVKLLFVLICTLVYIRQVRDYEYSTYYSHNKLSTHKVIILYEIILVGKLVTTAPPQYSSPIRLWLDVTTNDEYHCRDLPNQRTERDK